MASFSQLVGAFAPRESSTDYRNWLFRSHWGHGTKTPMSKKKTDLQAASKVLQGLLANSKLPLSDSFLRWKVWRFWPEIVSESVAKSCEPVAFDRGRLWIWVKSSARMQEMRFLDAALKQKINEYVGKTWVRSIRWTLDRRGVPKEISEEFKKFLEE